MIFRARLSLLSLETRENPSVPGLDPIGGNAPPPVDPPAPPPSDPAEVAIAAAIAGATVPPPVDPLLGNNGIYNVPLLP
jgi:hypothetical protein